MPDMRAAWFKFYPADFMNGVRGLSAQEVGLYTMLLARIYEENGPVEYHPLRLSTYCGMREKTFVKTLEKLLDLGKITLRDGMLSNDRAEVEISNRSHDLKNASKAGKASAEKRQQNQQTLATDVQRAINHTDTDTDTESSSSNRDKSEATVRADPQAAALPPDGTFRERLIEAAGGHPRGINPATGRPTAIGDAADMLAVDDWLVRLGLTESEIVSVIRDGAAKKRGAPASTLRFFDGHMRDFADQKRQRTGGASASSPTFSTPEAEAEKREIDREWAAIGDRADREAEAQRQKLMDRYRNLQARQRAS